MKKILKYLIFIYLLFMPFGIKAYGIDNYYIDAKIEANGDLLVQEYFSLTGTYNGFERIINYANDDLYEFDPNMNSFGGSLIHNGDGLEIIEVRAVPINSEFSFENVKGDMFDLSSNASKGDYGVYEETNKTNGKSILIYNPSSYNKAFYIKYRIKNIAIRHNDIGEIGWNVVGNELSESVGNLKLYLHIPGNMNIRAWAHGPLNGQVNIVDNETVLLTISNLSSYKAIDIRATFDLNVISESKKTTNTDALNKIILYEEDKAEQANYERQKEEKVREQERQTEIINYTIGFIILIIMIGVCYLIYIFYKKDPKTEFNEEYFRDIPSDDSPELVSYLFNKQISNNAMSAAMMDLIRKKIIFATKEEKDNFKLTINKDYTQELTETEKRLIKLIFYDKDTIHTSTMKEYAKKEYSSFISRYDEYKNTALYMGQKKCFYESDCKTKEKHSSSNNGCLVFIIVSLFIICPALPILFVFALGALFIYLIYKFVHFIKEKIEQSINDQAQIDYKRILLIVSPIFLSFISLYKIMKIFTFQKIYRGSAIIYIICMIISIFSIILLNNKKKRTIKGAEEYKKWKALKNFLKDFGKFDDKEINDIILWEKYLVYATLFGCAKKVLEQMKIELVNAPTDYFNTYSDLYTMNTSITRTLNTSYSIAISAYTAAHSYSSSNGGTSSSGSGSGGGFSSGGGSFGGGGGGGRF